MRKYSENKNKLNGQVFLIMTGFSCNNNCIMCSVRPKGLHYIPRKGAEILQDLKKGRKLKYERAEFTGGEPTLRKDLLKLIGSAKELGYREVALSTNGRALSSLEFLRCLKKNGLNRVTITLYSSDAQIHDGITRVPGSFKQTVQGIKNALSLGIVTSVNVVVFSKTINGLKKTGDFVASLGVKYWTLLDLIPDGYAFTDYKSLSVGPQTLRRAFCLLVSTLKKFEVVSFFDFSYCLFPNILLSSYKFNIIAAKGRTETINQVGYNPKRFQERGNVYYDIHKTRSSRCLRCAYSNECGGNWKAYSDLYGNKFLKPFKSKLIKL
ncbi:MAG: radical SAM protein [Candidatus Parcubacteria bacterium]|nr:radical SAM protein [Candidatus Parcubacteria bacterium]